MNANGVHDSGNDQFGETCLEEGHVPGCPGAAGGDHLVEDEDGWLHTPLSYENREGDPAFNGAFDRW